MQRDIFDSMADAVEKAAAVVPFMTARYQASENCKLEVGNRSPRSLPMDMLDCDTDASQLKFSKQRGIPICPVLLQKDWQQSGWLGLLIAGALWTPMTDEAETEANVERLCYQLALTLQTGDQEVVAAVPQPQTIYADGDAAREELARLAARERGTSQVRAEATSGARLPAQVPSLPPFMLTTPDMHATELLLASPYSGSSSGSGEDTEGSNPSASTVIVVGMGGIGK
jgi:hypothetical protein